MFHSEDSLIFIKIPEDYVQKYMPMLDKNIPLPVLVQNGKLNEFDYSKLTPEMILAGMMRVFAHDRCNENIDYFRKIFNFLRPGIKKEMTEAAVIKIKNSDYETAEEILLSLSGLNPEDVITKFNLAVLMEQRALYFYGINDFEKFKLYDIQALELYNELICTEPPFPPVFFNAAFFFIKKRDYVKAKKLLQTYISLEENIKAEYSDTEAEERLSKAQSVIKWISEQSVDDIVFKEAFDLMNDSQEEKALEKIRDFLVRRPKVWNGWFLLGWALRKQKRWEDGKNAFLKCLEFFDEKNEAFPEAFSDICNELSICLTELGETSQAEEFLNKAISKDPENIKLLSNMGTIALKKGDTAKAEAFFKTVLFLNPEDPIALSILNR